ncbi:putative ArsR family transcriptional regulator [Sinomonas atrocyanea]|uniref:helix-turn-helix domain-containing protein n=1 Tax=Sinomonas atrocyanea TaxID=37927 RepID=UPI002786AC12|nr:helix-turn-helix domain-containing protein [Sinomonas atrocyanea]MDP9883502.1 putative ArsR family transcriptional regulator [Sinomonas atrocyanea]
MENSLLGPQPAAPGPATPLSGARAAVLDLVRAKHAPCTVDELAGETAQHPNTVREHLEALVAAGLLEAAAGATAGEGRRGRPAKRYRPAELPPEAPGYAALAGVLAAEVARLAPDPAAAGAEAGRSWARRALAPPAGPVSAEDARRRVLAELDGLGFAIEPAPAPGAPAGAPSSQERVRLVACPLLAAARDEPRVVCSVHAGLVDESLLLLGQPGLRARLEPFAEPGACLLTIGTL